jgi:hypothetical protein
MVHDRAPSTLAGGVSGLILAAAAAGSLSSTAPGPRTISATGLTTISQPGPPQILHPAFDSASRWKLSGTGPRRGRQ